LIKTSNLHSIENDKKMPLNHENTCLQQAGKIPQKGIVIASQGLG